MSDIENGESFQPAMLVYQRVNFLEAKKIMSLEGQQQKTLEK